MIQPSEFSTVITSELKQSEEVYTTERKPSDLATKQTTGMKQVQLKDVKKGEFIRRKPDAKTTFIRGQYNRSMKDYSCTDFMDTNREIFLKGTTKVWIGFTF